MKHEETYTSTLHTHVHFFIYEPQVIIRVKAVLFVQHDLNENASNYDHFANFMCDKGYVVVVSDMVWHGHSLIDFEQGYFGKTDDIDACRWTIKTLWCIANRQWENAKLYEKKEEE